MTPTNIVRRATEQSLDLIVFAVGGCDEQAMHVLRLALAKAITKHIELSAAIEHYEAQLAASARHTAWRAGQEAKAAQAAKAGAH